MIKTRNWAVVAFIEEIGTIEEGFLEKLVICERSGTR